MGKDLSHYTHNQRIKYLRGQLIRYGYENLCVSDLAKQLGVARKTIHENINKIMDQIPKEELQREKAKAYYDFLGYDQHLAEVISRNARQGNDKTLIKAIDTASKVKQRKADVFESFGLKEKTSDINVQVNNYGTDVINELRELYSNADGDKDAGDVVDTTGKVKNKDQSKEKNKEGRKKEKNKKKTRGQKKKKKEKEKKNRRKKAGGIPVSKKG